MQILQITDLHLYGNAGGSLRGVETDSSLRHVLDDAAAAAFDYSAILVTGDVVQDDPTGYLHFKSLLTGLGKPVLCIPGNHDEPDAMRQSLRDEPFQYCGTRRIDDWQFIMLDSYDPGHVGGRLGAGELQRLDAALTHSAAQVYEGERDGVRLFGTPSTGAQFQPHSDRYAVDSRPPAYRRFELRPDGSIHSEVRWVDFIGAAGHAAAG
jgi:Icc protein